MISLDLLLLHHSTSIPLDYFSGALLTFLGLQPTTQTRRSIFTALRYLKTLQHSIFPQAKLFFWGHFTTMCHTTGYYAYCKACNSEIDEKSSTTKHKCSYVKGENLDFGDCDDFKDNRQDWPGYCEPCQVKANAALKKGAEIDKKWARGYGSR